MPTHTLVNDPDTTVPNPEDFDIQASSPWPPIQEPVGANAAIQEAEPVDRDPNIRFIHPYYNAYRGKNRAPRTGRATIAYVKENNQIRAAVTLCSHNDQFIRKTGAAIAASRLEVYDSVMFTIPDYIEPRGFEINDFILETLSMLSRVGIIYYPFPTNDTQEITFYQE